MANFFGEKQPGTWSYSSVTDPRWDGTGRVDDMVITAGPPPEALAHLDAKKAELGNPPEDLYISMYKD